MPRFAKTRYATICKKSITVKTMWLSSLLLSCSSVISAFETTIGSSSSQCDDGIQCNVFELEKACPKNSNLKDCDFGNCAGAIVLKSWNLTGNLDLTLFRKKITHLDLSDNKLSGLTKFPESSEAACPTMGLETLILANNGIQGEFDVGKLHSRDLRYLDLSGNYFGACVAGEYQLPQSTACAACSVGRFSSSPAQLSCNACPKGQFQNKSGGTACFACPTGKYNPYQAASSCQLCQAGQFNFDTGLSQCSGCPAGKYSLSSGSSVCSLCERGKYREENSSGVSGVCVDCPDGWTSPPGHNSSECTLCQPGWKIAGEDEFESSGKLCMRGQDIVALFVGLGMLFACWMICFWCCCIICDRMFFRDVNWGGTEPLLHWTCCFPYYCWTNKHVIACRRRVPWVMRKTVELLLCVYLREKIREEREKRDERLQLMKRWKPPQSKRDEDIADAFILPKKATQIQDCIRVFKAMEQQLLEHTSWDAAQKETIFFYRTMVVEYLRTRLRQAQSFEGMERLLCCYHMDELVDFQDMYNVTMNIIKKKEKDGFKKFTNVSKEVVQCCQSKCRPNPADLFDLYASGRGAYYLYHAFIEKVAENVEGAYCFKQGKQEDRTPSMKGIYRVLEKGMFKYNDASATKILNLSKVRDLVRGGIIHRKMQGLAEVVDFFNQCHRSGEITICRIKDRFSHPSASGWTDMMINFYLESDPGKHVCEVQLIHEKMKSQRKAQEGHAAYNVFRAAQEMLMTVGDLEELKWQVVSSRKSVKSALESETEVQPYKTNQVVPLN